MNVLGTLPPIPVLDLSTQHLFKYVLPPFRLHFFVEVRSRQVLDMDMIVICKEIFYTLSLSFVNASCRGEEYYNALKG